MTAVISKCGKYRYSLRREWIGGAGTVCFIMLNPSTADASIDDPTIRRCIGFAQRWGYQILEVVNLYAYRATRPRDMFAAADPVGPENEYYLCKAALGAGLRIAAWGSHANPYHVAALCKLLAPMQLHALALNAGGHPRHPLYVAGAAEPKPWQQA